MLLRTPIALALSLGMGAPAMATGLSVRTPDDTFTWISETQDILAEGILWNDRLGDGKDRYKSGGMTQSWLFPESIFSDGPWIPGQASALELQGRGFIATPDNGTVALANDRPFAQYVGVGIYLRTFGTPDPLNIDTHVASETRVGIELGLLGDPLPLFDIQDTLHDLTGSSTAAMNAGNTLDTEFLANIEARRTYRLHTRMGETDIELAPYGQVSLGMRENSVRIGGDIIFGTSLSARTWNMDPAIGALIPGGSQPRSGLNWLVWAGGDVGYVASDAFLDGGFSGDGPSIGREDVTYRLRAGLLTEYDNFALGYSITWLSPEFTTQPEGQLIGAVQVKYRF